MELRYSEAEKGSFCAYYPEIEMHSPFRRYSLIILREEGGRASVEELMEKWQLKDLAQKEACVIAFPEPPKDGWKSLSREELKVRLEEVQGRMCEPEDYVFETNELGIPTLGCMLNRWHLMNDTRYYVGIGEGARAACEGAIALSTQVAAVFCVTEESEDLPMEELTQVRMPVQCGAIGSFEEMYRDFFRKVRRLNTGKCGDPCDRMDFEEAGFDYYLNNTELGDQGGLAHTWFVHTPSKASPQEKLPMVIFFHGGSDNPAEAAEMCRFHEIGEREGFITVYPWGSDTASWNCNYTEEGLDDVAFVHALIPWLKAHYPVDASRIYLSGFSNGAAMAQIYAMEYPEEIAAVCHIDSNWPGHRIGLSNADPEKVTAFRKGWKRKEEFDYLMPVWYTYGTGEPSFPVFKGCSQQLQYDFWKRYNHIEIVETPERENPHPCGCGVPGQVCEELTPSKEYPHHRYQVNRFYSEGPEHLNLYNYVVMHDKGHEVAPMDPQLAWEYVRQFRREPDGSLGMV